MKRLRVRLKAHDRESLLKLFGPHVARDRVFLKSSLALPPGSMVIVALTYQNGDLALFGEGKVVEQRPADVAGGPGLSIAISWSPECVELVEWLILKSQPEIISGSHADLAADLTISGPYPTPPLGLELPDTTSTQYERIASPAEQLPTDELIPRVPDELNWTGDNKVDWENASGEVTPLARIDLSPSKSEEEDQAIRTKSSKRFLPPKADRIIGIDLGTTYSCAAIVEDGKARIIPSRRGTNTIPSVVLIHPEGKTIVGEPALRKQALFPGNTLVGVKRLIGRSFHSPIVQSVRERFAYQIVEGEDGEAAVLISEHRIALEEISALILKEIRESANLHLGEKVNRAVITCPAHYNERQRAAVRVAGELAGFHVERVLSEPTAAALSYGLREQKGRRRALIYDLGGGTFDASLMEIDGSVFSVLATGGDTFLGGADFDACIVELLLQHLRDKHLLDASTDPMAKSRLFAAAEDAKRTLSLRATTKVNIPHFVVHDGAPFSLEVDLDREKLDALFDPLVERSLAVCAEVCARAGVATSEVDEIIVVGGQSRSPIVHRRVAEMFGKQVRRDVHPDEAVAIGAAMFAASSGTFSGVVLVDTLPISIGIGLPGGEFQKILERDTHVPAKRVHRVTTTKDNQAELELAVFQGEDRDVWSNELVGLMRVSGLPPGPAGSCVVAVQFELTEEAILRLTAIEEKSGRMLPSEIVFRATPEELRSRLQTVVETPREPDPPQRSQPSAPARTPARLVSWLKKLATRQST